MAGLSRKVHRSVDPGKAHRSDPNPWSRNVNRARPPPVAGVVSVLLVSAVELELGIGELEADPDLVERAANASGYKGLSDIADRSTTFILTPTQYLAH